MPFPEGEPHYRKVLQPGGRPLYEVMLLKTVKDTPSKDQHLLEEDQEPWAPPTPGQGPWPSIHQRSMATTRRNPKTRGKGSPRQGH